MQIADNMQEYFVNDISIVVCRVKFFFQIFSLFRFLHLFSCSVSRIVLHKWQAL